MPKLRLCEYFDNPIESKKILRLHHHQNDADGLYLVVFCSNFNAHGNLYGFLHLGLNNSIIIIEKIFLLVNGNINKYGLISEYIGGNKFILHSKQIENYQQVLIAVRY
eukprot:snap_masked-scaffold_26-processed-gene-2.23-mRNA-1 protein AED:1.00 eAED:1.00 QI:0/0/0/0/1/1/2/0/107